VNYDHTTANLYATIGVVLVLIGYVIPTLDGPLWPTIQLQWGYSVLELTVGYTYVWVPLVVALPAILAVLGGLGFGCSKNIWHLRYGFLPALGLELLYCIVAVWMTRYGWLMLPFNSMVFFLGGWASHRAKRTVLGKKLIS
jgi:hypothetical protein